MRLKPQNSAKQLLEAELEDLRSVRSTLSDEVTDLIKQKNEAEREVKAEGERLMASLRVTEKECASKKTMLLQEIVSLEARKAEALRPLDEKRKALGEREKELDSAYALLAVEAQKTDEERAVLAEKTAQVADLLAEAKEKNAKADYRLARVRESEDLHTKSIAGLNEKWQAFNARVAEWEKSMKEREEALEIREKSLDSEKKWLVTERDRNAAEKRALQSERATIDAAFKEGRKKGYLK